MALDFPASPTNGQVFGNYTYNSTKGAWTATAQSPLFAVVGDVKPSSPANGQLWYNSTDGYMYMYYTDGTSNQWVQTGGPAFTNETGYRYVQQLELTSSTTFSKATYPWLRAIRVRCLGGGGGGGFVNVTPAAGAVAIASGGAGGTYAESFITDIASLLSSEAVTVGAAGAGGVGSTSTAATAGGTSSFGTTPIVSAAGGGLGASLTAAVAVPNAFAGTAGNTTGTGDIVIPGGGATPRWYDLATMSKFSTGGGNALFPQAQHGSATISAGAGASALAGTYGVGGMGAAKIQSNATTVNGGAGSSGLVILDLFA